MMQKPDIQNITNDPKIDSMGKNIEKDENITETNNLWFFNVCIKQVKLN